jgi:hypothetical protein
MSAALANDGVRCFLVLLVVLLTMMLIAVIRAPRWEGSSEDAPPQPATAYSALPASTQARAAAAIARAAVVLPARPAPPPQPGHAARMPVPAAATRQRGHATYAARHVVSQGSGEGTIPRPEVSGAPPWGPAPEPPGPIP